MAITALCCTVHTSLYLVITKNTKEHAPHLHGISCEVTGELSDMRRDDQGYAVRFNVE